MTPYQRLVAAGAALVDTVFLQDCEGAKLEAVQTFVANNRHALELARRALREKCSVPLKYEQSFFEEHSDDLTHLRHLTRTFALEVRVAKSQADFTRVGSVCIDMLELWSAARRGGLVVDYLVGVALSGVALDKLRLVRRQFANAQRTTLIAELERIEREQELFEEIAERDRRWEIAVDYPDEPIDASAIEVLDPDECGMSADCQIAIHEWMQAFSELPEPERRSYEADLDKRNIASLRMLTIDLALRSYCEVNSSYPDRLALLDPSYFNNLPLDPFTNEAFVYRKVATDAFKLYSLGPSTIDHGGVFGSWLEVQSGEADYCLDAQD